MLPSLKTKFNVISTTNVFYHLKFTKKITIIEAHKFKLDYGMSNQAHVDEISYLTSSILLIGAFSDSLWTLPHQLMGTTLTFYEYTCQS